MDTPALIDEVAHRLLAYIASKDDEARVNPAASLNTMRRTLDVQLPLEGHGLDAVLDDLDTFIANSVKTNRSEFMNPLGGLSLPAFAGEVIAALTNNSMYTYELSPIATVIEQTLVKRMSQMVGFPDGFGTFTTGGSNGNMLGMLCAREHLISCSTKRGFDGRSTVIFVSAEAHYSVLMAANVIGIGHQNIIKVQCDENGCMRPDRLKRKSPMLAVRACALCASLRRRPPPFAVPTTTSMPSPPSPTVRGCGSTSTLLGVEVACFQPNIGSS